MEWPWLAMLAWPCDVLPVSNGTVGFKSFGKGIREGLQLPKFKKDSFSVFFIQSFLYVSGSIMVLVIIYLRTYFVLNVW